MFSSLLVIGILLDFTACFISLDFGEAFSTFFVLLLWRVAAVVAVEMRLTAKVGSELCLP